MSVAVVYTTTPCGYCLRAKRLLERRGIPYREVDLTFRPDDRAALVRRTGQRTVPQVFIGEHHVGGYHDLEDLDRSGGLAEVARRELGIDTR